MDFEEKTLERFQEKDKPETKEKSIYEKVLEERKQPKQENDGDTKLSESKLKVSEVKEELKEKATTAEGQMKEYTHDEAIEASVKYFGGDTLAANVWVHKYALKDSDASPDSQGGRANRKKLSQPAE